MFTRHFLDFCHCALFIRGMIMGKSSPNNKKAAGQKKLDLEQ